MVTIKKSQINDIYNILNPIQLNKITNPVIRKMILKLVLELPKQAEAFRNMIDDVRKKLFSEFTETDVNAFQSKVMEIDRAVATNEREKAFNTEMETKEAYPELYTAYTNFISSINELSAETVELPVESVEMDDFIDALIGLDVDITAKELNILNPLFKNESAE